MFIVPSMGQSLVDAGADIPIYTEILMIVGLFLRGNWLPVLAVLVVLGIAGLLGRHAVAGAVGKLARGIPVLKGVVLTQETARFFTVMAALSRSGVPVADAIAVASNAISHPRLRKQFDRLRVKLVEGGVLPRLIDGVDALPIATRRLLIAADRAGDLDTAFDSLAEDMGDALESQTQRLLALLEPALIVMLAVGIGSLVLAILVPLITMSTQVS